MATITSEQAKIIEKLPRPQGRLELASFLGWQSFDEEDEFQRGLLLDFLYDGLMFTVEKGFPWETACRLLTLSHDMLEESKGIPIGESVKLYNTKASKLTSVINERNLKTFTEFFFTTFFTHYKLYQSVFTTEQEKLQTNMTLPVDIPTPPLAFKEGKDITIWDYQKKIEAIEAEEALAKARREEALKAQQMQDLEVVQEKQKKVEEAPLPLERQNLLDIMHEVASSHLTAASHSIKHNIRSSMEDLTFMLEKTAIPRPQAMAQMAQEEAAGYEQTLSPPSPSKKNFKPLALKGRGVNKPIGAPPRYKLIPAASAKNREKSSRSSSRNAKTGSKASRKK